MMTLTEKLPANKRDLPPKNRVWGFESVTGSCTRVSWSQVVETHQESRDTSTKLVSGISLWPSRDPIGEFGGVALYGFVFNSPINLWDILGLDGTYTVQSGDTLSEIAVQLGVTLSQLQQANPQIANLDLIYPNQVLNTPTSESPSSISPCCQDGESIDCDRLKTVIDSLARNVQGLSDQLHDINEQYSHNVEVQRWYQVVLVGGPIVGSGVSIYTATATAGESYVVGTTVHSTVVNATASQVLQNQIVATTIQTGGQLAIEGTSDIGSTLMGGGLADSLNQPYVQQSEATYQLMRRFNAIQRAYMDIYESCCE